MTDLTISQVRGFLLTYFTPAMRAAHLQPGDIGEDFDLLKAGLLDSLGILELLNSIERRFRVRVDFEPVDPDQLMRFGFLAKYIAEHAHSMQMPGVPPSAATAPAAPVGVTPKNDRLSVGLFAGLSLAIERLSELILL